MIQLKPFSLKLLFFVTGLPLILMFILTADKLQTDFMHMLWWGLIGIILVTRILLQKEKYETGAISISWKTSLLALTAIGTLLYFFFLMFI